MKSGWDAFDEIRKVGSPRLVKGLLIFPVVLGTDVHSQMHKAFPNWKEYNNVLQVADALTPLQVVMPRWSR